MPANFTEEQRQEIREKLIAVGYDLIREMGLKKGRYRHGNILSFL